MEKIKIVIADDHPLIRMGLIEILKTNKKFNVVGEASDGEEVLSLISHLNPEVVILDINMPKINGLKVCETLRISHPKIKILFLTMYKEEDLFNQAIANGAHGYILKDNAPLELISAINEITIGNKYFGIKYQELNTNGKNHIIEDSKIRELISRLTKTEKTVLLLISKQFRSKQIADVLFVTEGTIKVHRHKIIQKLNLSSDQNSLLKFAIENKDYLK